MMYRGGVHLVRGHARTNTFNTFKSIQAQKHRDAGLCPLNVVELQKNNGGIYKEMTEEQREAVVKEYANVIAEIGILSVEVACPPGAPQAWYGAVFHARAVFTPREARAAYLFIYSSCQSIPIIPIPPTQSGHEDDSEDSPNYTTLELSSYVDSLNLSVKLSTGVSI
ncbi:hypothetical protein V5O48_014300, partial [Marasmius crinis-equi]